MAQLSDKQVKAACITLLDSETGLTFDQYDAVVDLLGTTADYGTAILDRVKEYGDAVRLDFDDVAFLRDLYGILGG